MDRSGGEGSAGKSGMGAALDWGRCAYLDWRGSQMLNGSLVPVCGMIDALIRRRRLSSWRGRRAMRLGASGGALDDGRRCSLFRGDET